MLKLTYLYHSGFLLESSSAYVVFDFFFDGQAPHGPAQLCGVLPRVGEYCAEDVSAQFKERGVSTPDSHSVGVLSGLFEHLDKPCYFVSSHFHLDHFNPFILSYFDWVQGQKALGREYPPVHFVLASDIRSKRKKRCLPYTEAGVVNFLGKGERVEFAHDGLWVEAFGSTDSGCSFVVAVDGMQIFHAGDLNEWHWQDESDDKHIVLAKLAYSAELNFIQSRMQGRLGFDVVMFPCDPTMGHNFFSGAIKLMQAIPTGLLVPMHLWEHMDAFFKEEQETKELSKVKLIYSKESTVRETGPIVQLKAPALVAAPSEVYNKAKVKAKLQSELKAQHEMNKAHLKDQAQAQESTDVDAQAESVADALQNVQMWVPAYSGDQCQLERV